jgi:hypothetical protein
LEDKNRIKMKTESQDKEGENKKWKE